MAQLSSEQRNWHFYLNYNSVGSHILNSKLIWAMDMPRTVSAVLRASVAKSFFLDRAICRCCSLCAALITLMLANSSLAPITQPKLTDLDYSFWSAPMPLYVSQIRVRLNFGSASLRQLPDELSHITQFLPSARSYSLAPLAQPIWTQKASS
jgi:hypothetical protein